MGVLLSLLGFGPVALAQAAGVQITQADGPITVDGVLDEADWARAQPIEDFVRHRPTRGGSPPCPTEVRVLQDERNLYVGARVYDCDYEPRVHVAMREDVNWDDQIGVYLDPFADGRTGYIFYINPAGIQQDLRHGHGNWFPQWNTVFSTEGRVTEDGYIIEAAFPFRSLRYPSPIGPRAQPEQTWGLIITRKVPHEGAKYAWPTLTPNHPRVFTEAAPLTGVRPPKRGADVELQPVLTGRFAMDRLDPAGLDDPSADLAWEGADPWTNVARPGMDARWSPTADVGLALTLHPDFSQVEGDVAQIDLNQRFAFFYTERRPFFLDGIESFEDPLGTLYTRSIVEPAYGLKFSGQQGDVGFGVLHALDRSPATSPTIGGTRALDSAQDGAMNTFARVRLDVLGEGGSIGLSLADKRAVRDPLDGPDTLAPPSASNDVGTVDLRLPLDEVWTLTTAAAGAWTTDADEELTGGAARLDLERSPDEGLVADMGFKEVAPNHRRDMGFLGRAGVRSVDASLGWAETFGTHAKSTFEPGVFGYAEQEFESALAYRDGSWAGNRYGHAGVYQDLELGGIHELDVFAHVSGQRFSDTDLTGWLAGAWYEAQLDKRVSIDTGTEVYRELDFDTLLPAHGAMGQVSLRVRPTLGTRGDFDVVQQWFTPEGQPTEQATRLYTRLQGQFTRELGLRVIGQTVLAEQIPDPQVDASTLLTWMKHPGTEAYLGATWSVQTDGSGLSEQVLFAKITRLFRL